MFSSESPILAIVLSSLVLTSTREAYPQAREPFAKHIVRIENIPSPTRGKVNAVFRDQRGFLWFGTSNSLLRYDGYETRVYRIALGKHDEQRIITGILANGDSSLLLATWNGLWIFDFATEQFAPYPGGVQFGSGRIEDIAEDKNRTLWIGTVNTGVFSYDQATGEKRSLSSKEGLSHDRINCLRIDDSGMVWIGTSNGLNCLDPQKGSIVQYRSRPGDLKSLSSDDIKALCEDDKGMIWVGTLNGLNRINRKTKEVERVPFLRGVEHEIRALARDPSGRMWISVWGAGLFTHVDGTFARFSSSTASGESVSDPHVVALYVDPTSTPKNVLLWIGTRGAGVDRLRTTQNPFATFTRNENLPVRGHGAVLSLCQDRKGILWAGLWGGGLNGFRYDNGRYVLVYHYVNKPGDPFSLPNNTVNCITEDRAGTLWVGTNGGLAALPTDRRRLAVYKYREGDSAALAGRQVGKVFEDRQGRLWFCTEGGLSQLVPSAHRRFRNYLNRPDDAHTHQRIIGGNKVSDILQDSSGYLWVAMHGGGLNRLASDGSYRRFLFPGDSDRTQESWVYNFHQDRNGMFWLSTAAGLVTFDPTSETFARFPAEELHSAHVFDIANDESGMLWLSTGIGLVRMDPATRRFKRFDQSYGLSFNELYSTFFRLRDGRFIVGGLNGFVQFSPESVITTTPVPTVVITAFSIFDKTELLRGSVIRLAHSQNFFSFSFAALDYTEPRLNQYAYRMTGVDPDWVHAGTRNYASYTNIDPGEYVFEVKGASSEGVWNQGRHIIAVDY